MSRRGIDWTGALRIIETNRDTTLDATRLSRIGSTEDLQREMLGASGVDRKDLHFHVDAQGHRWVGFGLVEPDWTPMEPPPMEVSR